MEKDDILLDFTLRIIVDDVSSEQAARLEYRASIYEEDELVAEAWNSSIKEVIEDGLQNWIKEK